MIQTHIELNHTKTKMESVTLTLPELHNLKVTFTFEGRTLIANANELVNALRYHIYRKKQTHTAERLSSRLNNR